MYLLAKIYKNRGQTVFKSKSPFIWLAMVCTDLSFIVSVSSQLYLPASSSRCLGTRLVALFAYLVFLVIPCTSLYRLYTIFRPKNSLDIVVFSEQKALGILGTVVTVGFPLVY